jgi:YVTN family beta-propeller protein
MRTGTPKALALAVGLAGLAPFLIGCQRSDFPQYPANYREYVYVTNGQSGTLSVLDAVNLRLDREIRVGLNPVAVAASPTRNEVYVVNAGAASGLGMVSVVNAENNSVVATIPVLRAPVSIEVDLEGRLAWVTNTGSNTISLLDLANRREIARIGTGKEPVEARLSPDGKTLVVANRGDGSASVFDAPAGRLRAVFEGCPGADDIVILPDSSKAFVACSAGHQVMSIGLARAATSGTQESATSKGTPQTGSGQAGPVQAGSGQAGFGQTGPAQPDRLEALMDVGRAPVQLALKPDGGELFISNSGSDTISEMVTNSDDVGGSYLIGDDPIRGLVSSDNLMLYEANFHSQYVTIYSIEDGKRLMSIHVGDGPSAMAFSTAGNLLFVVDNRSSDVAVIRTRTSPQSLFTLLPTGRGPNAIAVKSFSVK